MSEMVKVGYTRDGGCVDGFLYRGTIKSSSGKIIWISIKKHLNRDRPSTRSPSSAMHDARRALIESGAMPLDGSRGNRFAVD